MSIKKCVNNAWTEISLLNKYLNNAWQEISSAKKYLNNAWEEIYPVTPKLKFNGYVLESTAIQTSYSISSDRKSVSYSISGASSKHGYILFNLTKPGGFKTGDTINVKYTLNQNLSNPMYASTIMSLPTSYQPLSGQNNAFYYYYDYNGTLSGSYTFTANYDYIQLIFEAFTGSNVGTLSNFYLNDELVLFYD